MSRFSAVLGFSPGASAGRRPVSRIIFFMSIGSSQIESSASEAGGDRLSARRQLDALSQDRMRQFLERRINFSVFAMAVMLSILFTIQAVFGLWGSTWLVLTSVPVTGIWAVTLRQIGAKPPIDEVHLRRTEVIAFVCTFACLALLTFSSMEASSRALDITRYVRNVRESLVISVAMLLIYGMTIPNRSRRSLVISSALTTIPMGAVAISLLTHASAFPVFPVSLRFELATELMIPLGVAIGCAVIGAGVGDKIRDRCINIDELGPYQIKAPLGSGGMGDVYLAEHRLLKRLCAVKLIHPDKAGDSRVKARFEQEVKATAILTHPNTVHVYDYGTAEGGRFFYAMEFLDGMNLDQCVQQYGPMPPGRVIYILKQICGALQEAWYEGLVHRDIKPSNIFLSERGQMFDVAKLLDFGLVSAASGHEVGMRRQTTVIHGSPEFMCPEQATGIEPDCRGDLYSLGAVAWFLLTGHPPFRNEDPIMLIVEHATGDVPDFAETGVSVPDDLAAVISKCLRKKPEDRFEDPRKLLLALEACEADADWDWLDAENWWLTNIPAYGNASNLPSTADDASSSSTDGRKLLDQTLILEGDDVRDLAGAEPAST